MINMAAMPIYSKNLKNLLLQNQLTDDLETWYVALCVWVLPRLFKLSPWVDLDPFYAKVKFGHIGFCMGKSENYLFFRKYCSLRSQSCSKHSAKWVYEVGWVSKVKVILWPSSKVTQISKLKLVFLKNSLAIWNQSSYESLKETKNENKIQMSWVTWLTWPPCPYVVKTLKNLLLQNQLTDNLETWYVALCMWVLPRLFKLSPWLDLDPFYAKVKFGHIGFCWEKMKIIYFLETIAALGLKVARSIQLNEFMKLGEYQRSRSFFDLHQRSLRFQS